MRSLCLTVMGLYALSFNPLRAADARPDLSGVWHLNTAKSEMHQHAASAMTLTVEQKGNSLHIVKTVTVDGKEKKSDFQCTTDGKECDIGGVKVSLWYSGGSLVEMDNGSDDISSSNMTLSGDKNSIQIDIEHIVPSGDADKLVLDKT